MNKILFVITLLILFNSCGREFDISNINGNQISVLGHGGMGIEHAYPLNSFESIQNALSIGADGTELDVQMTKDSVLVVFHDQLLEHSTNMEGAVYQQNWADIKGATYTLPPLAQYKMVTLDALFSNLISPQNFIYFLDCKNFDPDNSDAYVNTFNNALLRLIDKHNLSENIVVEFKRQSLIIDIKNKRPEIKIFYFIDFEIGLPFAIENDLEGMTSSYDNITTEQIELAHNNGIEIAVFNTHSKNRNIEAIEKNVDHIQSDKLSHLIRLLK